MNHTRGNIERVFRFWNETHQHPTMDFASTLAFLALVFSASGLDIPRSIPKTNSSELLSKINQGIQHDLSEVKQPVVKTIAKAVFAPCEEVKKLLGVQYDQLDGKKEPDVNSLTLKYRSRDVNVSYNINSAARIIAEETRTHTPDEILYIFIHGFTDNPGQSSFGNISEALHEKGITNVLALDAGFLLEHWYLRSTSYVRFVGEKLGAVLTALVKKGISPKSIHIIGHSLGSHMASFAGKTFQGATGERVGRITGLDPAGPCFTQAEPELRLQASDADFVDVIHTNAGVLGIDEPVGHVDYYPNGGSEQPNCKLSSSCSHSRAWLMYSESVLNEQAFPAVGCGGWKEFTEGKCGGDVSYMGFASDPKVRGKYYLQTSGDSPYGLGEKGLKYEDPSFTRNIAKALF
ncbi:pancreatic lipase-related protein 2 [Amyelois transitella]|uniref:pancreatic lipase-related protein 2 n=1 Tax=Amyelois transitella TaxID=680683 RepID=UPI00067D6B17|nr:pancreatic lipase-related protein 2 [Amyelois transitella]